ncbi:D-alanyl-glycyl endopeptidase-like protein [Trypanosoma conorhini]|uniref:D-alanyl-glycyl endopeptidase-like protein n=1 Tax=Trypanosoma conorhini TaxID=83891 RepID=A0A3R7N2W0_9TRYP|nr:D-alanyl-glycyl endopeptidase-like protein [Trypanosoma conorhini]RNE99206.1 D-alanyl-glycyl endopeptidase-like protein [Trypanosoma conorhini]
MSPREATKRTRQAPRVNKGAATSMLWCPSLPYCVIAVGIWGLLACLMALLLTRTSHLSRLDTVHEGNDTYRLSEGCSIGCDTTFGTILGVANGVFGFSNCNATTCISNIWHPMHALMGPAGISSSSGIGPGNMSGIEWQCVEFARRYWMLRGTPVPASFEKVAGAADIWSLTSVQLLDGSTTPLLKYANNVSARAGGSAPRVGDLLIYPRQEGGFPFGHVAVVVAVKSESLLVAEQNWDNKVWPAPHHNYSREIPMHHNTKEDIYEVAEADKRTITGWVRYAE